VPCAPRVAEHLRGKVVVDEPNRNWSTDQTTVYTQQGETVEVVPVID
jgi:hypothetical protein